MGRVIVVGSVNVDLVVVAETLPRPGETVAGGTFARHGGGKGANQAVAAARRGASVALVAAVGDDDLGAAAVAELAAEGIDVSHVERRPDATGVALIAVDAAGENQIAVASGANAALDGALVGRALHALTPAAGDVLLLGFEVPDAAVETAVAHAGEATVVLNPAPARALPAARAIVTPNTSEAEQLSGEADPRRAAAALQAHTGAPVLVTLGAAGALLLDEQGTAHELAAPPAEVVDTTGAGDALNGALAAALAAGTPLLEAAREAVTVASQAVGAAGARTVGRPPAVST